VWSLRSVHRRVEPSPRTWPDQDLALIRLGLIRLGLTKRLGIAAHHGCLRQCPTRADVVGSDVDGTIEHGIAGEAEVEVDAAIVAEIYHFRAATSLQGGHNDLSPRSVILVAGQRRRMRRKSRRRQNHHAAIRRDPPPLKAAVIFLPWTAGKAKGSDLSSVMADVAGEDQVDRMASATNPHARILTLHPPPSNPGVVNKMG